MAARLPSKDELLAKLREYNAYIEGGSPSEARADQMIGALDALVPHANISDLIFWGEKERTEEEVVSESLAREMIWEEGGDRLLLSHIRSQLERALADTSVKAVHRNYAVQTLAEVTAEILHLRSETRH